MTTKQYFATCLACPQDDPDNPPFKVPFDGKTEKLIREHYLDHHPDYRSEEWS